MAGIRPVPGGGRSPQGGGGGGGGGEAPRAAGGASQYGGPSGHRLMVPPPGYKFIPRTEKICGQYGCFECYDIFCERCETKDRRIIELEMRAADMARHVQTLYSKLQRTPQGGATGGPGSPGAASPSSGTALAGQPFATTRSPVLEDPHRGAYIAQTDYYAVNAIPDKR
ncbi:unnamed protein product [Prorocentrum cordatum]|uniref:Uncharacterized protein n=1 Tax=Prorocentrum cordatum TaxID=2364126 RepID=A0ABN9UJ93_9DINO|nr:unnamed protein product [Polarella glacialis]